MIMSFAAPLGVGLTSDAEYFDLDLDDAESSSVMQEKLDRQMAPGFRVLSVREIPSDKASKGMTLVAAADYEVRLADGVMPESLDENRIRESLGEFLSQDEIRVMKKTKKGEREIDIRPLIYSLTYRDGTFSMTVSQGSTDNLKPGLVIGSFAAFLGVPVQKSDLQIHRKEIYANTGKDGERHLVPLEDLGSEIPGGGS